MDKKERLVVYDCDIGTDDAWGLAMMLRAEELALPEGRSVRVVAITSVQGNTDVVNGTLNALRVLHTLDRRDVSRYSNSRTPQLTPDFLIRCPYTRAAPTPSCRALGPTPAASTAWTASTTWATIRRWTRIRK